MSVVGPKFNNEPGLTGELVDWLTETVVLAADPLTRAHRICAVLETLAEAVEWRGGTDGPAELSSVSAVLREAHAHEDRMHLALGLAEPSRI